MRDLDDTDFEILELLRSDARRPYSEIADIVDLSAPAVSDRVARLEERGIIRRFTLDIDHSQLEGGVPVLIELEVASQRSGDVRETLLETTVVEHVFTTATSEILVTARLSDTDVSGWLDTVCPTVELETVAVTLLSEIDWLPSLDNAAFGLTCAECSNTVDSEGVSTRIDGTLYDFCCPSCEARFEETYDEIQQGA